MGQLQQKLDSSKVVETEQRSWHIFNILVYVNILNNKEKLDKKNYLERLDENRTSKLDLMQYLRQKYKWYYSLYSGYSRYASGRTYNEQWGHEII